MVFNDAEDEALRTRRDQKAGQRILDADGRQGVGLAGSTVGYQPLRVDRANWERPSYCDQPGGIPSGGILDQLIESTRNQLAILDVQRDKTADYLQQLEVLREQLNRKEQ